MVEVINMHYNLYKEGEFLEIYIDCKIYDEACVNLYSPVITYFPKRDAGSYFPQSLIICGIILVFLWRTLNLFRPDGASN